jgi:LmbE family N-acetylglucosaminyl deacetylase
MPVVEKGEAKKKMPSLLCITAHPDDEAGGFGGALLHYAEKGVETYVICLTPGQAATHRGGARSDDELSTMRRQEFAAACKMLQVKQGDVLSYPDGKLDQQNLFFVVEDLTRRVRQIRPDVMMTMGTEGAITAHPDHSMVSVFGTLAVHWASRSNRFADQLKNGLSVHQTQKIYYATAGFTMPDRQPVALPPSTMVLNLTPAEVETKVAAFKCHTSQAPLFPFFEETIRRRGKTEQFHLAAAATPRKLEVESDMFEGI